MTASPSLRDLEAAVYTPPERSMAADPPKASPPSTPSSPATPPAAAESTSSPGNTENEEERFFAQTAQGPDGHVFWVGALRFTRNDGATRLPGRWWWEHQHGPVAQNAIIRPTCGERHCINPAHSSEWTRPQHERLYNDDAILGALQAYALRTGRAPSQRTWAGPPSSQMIAGRFGSWRKALEAAGLQARHPHNKPSVAQCLEAIRLARRLLGYWPSFDDFRFRPELKAALESAGLPRRPNTITKRLGCRWPEALRRAGKRGRP